MPKPLTSLLGAACAAAYAAAKATAPEPAKAPAPPPSGPSGQVLTVRIPQQLQRVIPPPASWDVERDENGRWRKGASANPGGRGRRPFSSVADLIASFTGNGAELIAHAVLVMRGELSVIQRATDAFGQPVEIETLPSITDQSKARGFLADRLWGRAPETVRLETSVTSGSEASLDPGSLSESELRTLLDLSARAIGQGPGRAEGLLDRGVGAADTVTDAAPAPGDGAAAPAERGEAPEPAGVREGAPQAEPTGDEPR